MSAHRPASPQCMSTGQPDLDGCSYWGRLPSLLCIMSGWQSKPIITTSVSSLGHRKLESLLQGLEGWLGRKPAKGAGFLLSTAKINTFVVQGSSLCEWFAGSCWTPGLCTQLPLPAMLWGVLVPTGSQCCASTYIMLYWVRRACW